MPELGYDRRNCTVCYTTRNANFPCGITILRSGYSIFSDDHGHAQCKINRAPTIQLPLYAYKDPYSLFTLFLTEAHFETIAANTNRYAEVKKAGSEGKRA